MGFRGSAGDGGQSFTRVGLRATVAMSSGALFLGVAGCSVVDSADAEDTTPDNALSQVDPCSILRPDKAEQVGLPAHGNPDDNIASQRGCKYIGDYAGIGVYRFHEDTLDELGKRSIWNSFKPLQVNSRRGAEAIQQGSTGNQCSTAISAGGGVVMVDAIPADPRKEFDACAESLKVAKLIESDLPE